MSHCQAALLLDRGALRVTGADAAKFLQGIITSDLDKTEDGGAVHAALLTPQGKILFDFFVVADDGGFLIEAAKDTLPELSTRLGFYRLRAAVEIAEVPDLQVAAVWDGTADLPEGATSFADPRLAALGTRILLPKGSTIGGCDESGAGAYHAHRIRLGVPEGGRDFALGDSFPHEALFDQLNGVDFEKGCFVGQEVVSRMQHRGTTRKRVVPVEGDAPLESGTEVRAGDLPIGRIGSVDGQFGLALLRLDRAADASAKGTKLTAGETAITLHKPAFAQFDVPA
ncbi:folate-binding protein YgfZ [Methyloceanibacter sp.]|jgi:folate-binding protein YgfZ|uniref:CAF17-like 4Fe-4S cluster assembly/insertion protein YgfZ n=1 Tax=Methyloceanibacter sp. TaxID=1965321 RepID=UPI0035673A40|nr:folate-binding protein YgfZ [Phycisphaerae bacterium]